MNAEEYDEAMKLAQQSTPTWKKNPPGTRQNERDSLKDKATKALGGDTHKMKRNGKW